MVNHHFRQHELAEKYGHEMPKLLWQDEDWQRVNQALCRGDRGTLITWTNTGKATGGE